jgi:phosphoglycolate phosphatase-like HAD superfamily hydrolase
MLQSVIFDVDGTLVDSVDLHARAWQDAFAAFGYQFSGAEIRSQIGKGADQLLAFFLSPAELEKDGGPIEHYRGAVFKKRHLKRVHAFPEVRALFQRIIADGNRIALASSCKQDELEIYKRIAGIADLVQSHTTSDDAERSKPHPDIFEAALRQLPGTAAADAVAVGDTPYDAEAAGKAGIRTIGLLSGGFAEADLLAAGCIEIYHDPADLLARYESSVLAVGSRTPANDLDVPSSRVRS